MFKVYKSNFCCDCGEKLVKKHFLEKIFFYRYFCSNCIRNLRQQFLIQKILFILLFNIIFPIILINISLPDKFTASKTQTPSTTPSPFIASKMMVNKSIIQKDLICGAKTLKGKKCQRKVKNQGYCWQHKKLEK